MSARGDIQRTLTRYFELVADETWARAVERADAMLAALDEPALAPRLTARDVILTWAEELGGSAHSFEVELDRYAHELAEKQRAAFPPEDYEVMRAATDLIDPEVTR